MKKRGFTLIEMIVALSLAVLVLSAAFYTLSLNLKTWEKVLKNVEGLQVASMVLERVGRDIRSADRIIEVKDRSLTIELEGQKVLYDFKDFKVRRKKGKTSAYLTDQGDLTDLSFLRTAGRLIRITLQAGKRTYTVEVLCRNE
jgi:prepilin-type N-terminal cleavage/methylation domain-containing protein